jgi:DNA adenine methylase
MNAVMRYPGGKARDAAYVASLMPEHRVFVSPYCGAVGELLAKPKVRTEILNDIDGRVVNLLRVLRDKRQSQELADMVALTPYSRKVYEDAWAAYVSLEIDKASAVDQALNLLIRTFMSHSSRGLVKPGTFDMRINPDAFVGSHNAWVNYPNHIPTLQRRLASCIIEQKDGLELLKHRPYDRDDALIFIDPPYMGAFGRYPHDLTDHDHHLLCDQAVQLKHAYVMVCGYPSDLYEAVLQFRGEFERIEYPSQKDNQTSTTECIWLNPRAAEAVKGGRLF